MVLPERQKFPANEVSITQLLAIRTPPSRSRNSLLPSRRASDNRLASDRASGPAMQQGGFMNRNAQFCQRRRARSPLSRFCRFRSRCRRRFNRLPTSRSTASSVGAACHRCQGGDHTSLASGIMEGSRWGLRGTSRNGRQSAMFVLESRFEADTGAVSVTSDVRHATARPADRWSAAPVRLRSIPPSAASSVSTQPGRLFDRQAFVGMVTPFGAIPRRRQYTPASEISNRYDAFANASDGVAWPIDLDSGGR